MYNFTVKNPSRLSRNWLLLLTRVRKRLRYSRFSSFYHQTQVFRPRNSIWGLSRWRGKIRRVALIIIVLVGFVWLTLKSHFFALETVRLKSVNGEEYLKVALVEEFIKQKLAGTNLIFLRTADLIQDLEVQFPSLLSVRFSKVFPSTLSGELAQRKGILKLTGLGQSQSFLIDQNGVIFAPAVAEDLPQIFLKTPVVLSDQISSQSLNSLLEIISKLPEEKVVSVEFLPHGYLDVKLDTFRVLFSTNKPVDEQLMILREIRQRYQLKNVRLELLDLRFDRPVVSSIE